MSRVLVVTDKYAAHNGGTAVCWSEWVRRWPTDMVCVITRRFSPQDDAVSPPCHTIRVPFVNIPKLRMPLLWLTMFAALLREIFRDRPAALHCGQVLETGWMGLVCKAIFGIPFFLTLHGEEITIYAKGTWTRKALNLVLAHSAGVGVNTKFTELLLRKHTSFRRPVVVAYPGVDTTRYHGPHRGWNKAPVLVTLGRLVPRKGHDLVIKVLPRLLQQFPDLRYVVLGGGSERPRLEELVNRMALSEHVTFAGQLPEAQVVDHLRSAQLFVHPNRDMANGDREGFGIVFLEANACGLPVIGGNSGGAPEAISEGKSGFLVDSEDLDDLTEKITRLLSDQVLWESISLSAQDWARQFTWERSAAALWELTTGQ